MIRFPFSPPIGFVVEIDGQAYSAAGQRFHEKPDGSCVSLLVWESNCSDCGVRFEVATTDKFSPNRRCAEHRKPGKRVKTKAEYQADLDRLMSLT